ncbi:MAG TPA: hypothetical protein VEC16_05535 [Alphaproteobacteria bacterium]|nr:hypothetical protein [Alphaproteobacteria bacterium]
MGSKYEFLLLAIVSIVAIVGIVVMITGTESNLPDSQYSYDSQDLAGMATAGTCIDSDSGNLPYTEGTVSYNGVEYKDEAINDGTFLNLKEYYCDNNEVKSVVFQCPYGLKLDSDGYPYGNCVGGTMRDCINEDDDGVVFDVAGSVVAGDASFSDYCLDNTRLLEYYCNDETFDYTITNCAGGCSLAECKEDKTLVSSTPVIITNPHTLTVNFTNKGDSTIIMTDVIYGFKSSSKCQPSTMDVYYNGQKINHEDTPMPKGATFSYVWTCGGDAPSAGETLKDVTLTVIYTKGNDPTEYMQEYSIAGKYVEGEPTQIKYECSDSDEGFDVYEKGTAELTWGGENEVGLDKCLSVDSLREFYCYDDVLSSSTFECSGECSSGACKKYETEDCDYEEDVIIKVGGQISTMKAGDSKLLDGLRVIVKYIDMQNIGGTDIIATLIVARGEEIIVKQSEAKTYISDGIAYKISVLGGNGDCLATGPDNVLLKVNGVFETMDEGNSKTINGLPVYVKDISITNIGGDSVSATVQVSSSTINLERGEPQTITYNGELYTLEIVGGNSGEGAPSEPEEDSLGSFLSSFEQSESLPDTLFVVGRSAAADDLVSIANIMAKLQKGSESSYSITFDDEITSEQIDTSNVVVVGGMCVNKIAAKIYGYPSSCVSEDKIGVGKISIIPNKKLGTYMLLVHGYNAEDTALATKIAANWEDYEDILSVFSQICVSGPESNPQIYDCSD